jgi:hypothetical protein
LANSNPITKIQSSYGMSDVDFSTLLGISTMTLANAKRGMSIRPAAILRGLSDLGFDPGEISESYTRWRTRNRQELIKQVRAQ